MTKEEFETKFNEIGSLEDPALMRTKLTELKEDICGVFTSHDEMSKSVEKYKADNEELRNANMKLFKQVGVTEKPNVEKEVEKESLKYDDLFNEEGGLK